MQFAEGTWGGEGGRGGEGADLSPATHARVQVDATSMIAVALGGEGGEWFCMQVEEGRRTDERG